MGTPPILPKMNPSVANEKVEKRKEKETKKTLLFLFSVSIFVYGEI